MGGYLRLLVVRAVKTAAEWIGWGSWAKLSFRLLATILTVVFLYVLISDVKAEERAELVLVGFIAAIGAFTIAFVVAFILAPYGIYREQTSKIQELEGRNRQRTSALAAQLEKKFFEGEVLLKLRPNHGFQDEAYSWIERYVKWCIGVNDILNEHADKGEQFMFKSIAPESMLDINEAQAALRSKLGKLRLITGRYMESAHSANEAISSKDQT